MVPALPATLVSSLSSAQGEKVKLRVSYGGDFVEVSPADATDGPACGCTRLNLYCQALGAMPFNPGTVTSFLVPGCAGCQRQVELQGREEPRGYVAREF